MPEAPTAAGVPFRSTSTPSPSRSPDNTLAAYANGPALEHPESSFLDNIGISLAGIRTSGPFGKRNAIRRVHLPGPHAARYPDAAYPFVMNYNQITICMMSLSALLSQCGAIR
ncbi:hypothetical protein BDV37DRAFT_256234 [Aspergillus pseudonomiae]|uniref:Uncharacterized protein n=1 Tax=Aspergillus pseudonomiae TaxID=1506151 RepID=A0A5N7D3J6_9EURO|nr:uncharacterized protein BDV37DRAFT_256234 [Aspergillus pseudonomiae]KAE8400990.1 hypothetical protein BDV37DRAFT_256234 [Aspergillus pseudonomiae]